MPIQHAIKPKPAKVTGYKYSFCNNSTDILPVVAALVAYKWKPKITHLRYRLYAYAFCLPFAFPKACAYA